EMATGQRPWIKPTIQIVGLRFANDRGAEITYSVDFKNVGKSPAQNIKSRLVAAIMTEQNAITSIDEERNQCDLARKDSGNDMFPGIFLFPDEEAPDLIGGKGIGRAYVSAAEYSKAWPSPDKLTFKIFGCFDYSFSTEAGRHGSTGFAYLVSKKIPEKPGLQTWFSPVVGEVPIDQIIFRKDPFSGGFVN
ncbi:MAG: hypothetical protein ACREDV_00760, partial [Methylocella sp.]